MHSLRKALDVKYMFHVIVSKSLAIFSELSETAAYVAAYLNQQSTNDFA